MSLRNFEAVANAYDGRPTDSHIRFVDGVARERVHLGVTRPTAAAEGAEHQSDLVGIWLVDELDGTRAYHVVHSDTRERSGLSISRTAVDDAETVEEGLRLPGAFEHHDIILRAEGVPTIGGLALEQMAALELDPVAH